MAQIFTRVKILNSTSFLPFSSATFFNNCLVPIHSCRILTRNFSHSSIYNKNILVIRSMMTDSPNIPCVASDEADSKDLAKVIIKLEDSGASAESAFINVSLFTT